MRMCFDLCHSHSIACRLVTEPCETIFAPSTPHIYKSCTLLEQKGEKGTLINDGLRVSGGIDEA